MEAEERESWPECVLRHVAVRVVTLGYLATLATWRGCSKGLREEDGRRLCHDLYIFSNVSSCCGWWWCPCTRSLMPQRMLKYEVILLKLGSGTMHAVILLMCILSLGPIVIRASMRMWKQCCPSWCTEGLMRKGPKGPSNPIPDFTSSAFANLLCLTKSNK